MYLEPRLYLLVGVFYLSLVSGGVFTFGGDGGIGDLAKIVIALLSFIFVLRLRPSRSAVRLSLAFLLVFSIPLFISSFRAHDFEYAIYKIDAAVFGSILAFLLAGTAVERYGFLSFCRAFVYVAALILVLTLVYKIAFGFSDRNVRFFLNGPIVFGWLMGLACVFAVCLWSIERSVSYLLFSLVFALAVLWTQSKGPLLALLVSYVFVFLIHLRPVQRLKILGLVAPLGLALFSFDLSNYVDTARFVAIERVLSNSLADSDYGSIGARAEMYGAALALSKDNPMTGIGLGNWQWVTGSAFKYPHNQHLEALAENGLFFFLIYFIFILIGFLVSNFVVRSALIFFFIAASFSGDFSYMRYLLSFCLLAYHLRILENKIEYS